MSSKLKVCLVGNDYKQQFPLIEYGGIEASVENICNGLSKYFKDEIDFCVIVPKITENKKEYDFKIIETNFIESSKSGLHGNYFGHEVNQILSNSKIKPDIIWCCSEWSSKTLHDLNIPMIVSIADSEPWRDGKYIFKENVYYRFISKFLYDINFNYINNDYVNKIKSKSFWCHYGLDDSEYDLEINKEDYILWVAGLNWGFEGKGLNIFIEMAKIREDKTFVAYGTGNEQLELFLKNASKELKNFNYMGGLKRGEQHKKVFQKAKLFAFLTQIPEAFGRTGIEAISKGTPILGTRHAALPELYDDVGVCTNYFPEMIETLDKDFNYNDIYEKSKKFHVKNEIRHLLDKSIEILNKK